MGAVFGVPRTMITLYLLRELCKRFLRESRKGPGIDSSRFILAYRDGKAE